MRQRKQAGIDLALILVAVALVVGACWAAGDSPRPKVLGIAYVTFKATDLEKAKDFYGGELGLPSASPKYGNKVQASYTVNQDQHIELAKTAPGTGGSYLVEIGFATDESRQNARVSDRQRRARGSHCLLARRHKIFRDR